MIEFIIYLLKVVILSIIEGITEFIPVSSSGHMILFKDLFGLGKDPFINLFMVVIQLGAIMAIVVLYKDKFTKSLMQLKPGQDGFNFWSKVAVAIIPAGIIGLLFDDIIEEKLMSSYTVSLALIVGGILMIVCENKFRNQAKVTDINKITYKQAFIVGVFQILAIVWPGFSRSASTIIGGWIMGFTTIVATEFSFFLAVPIMALASAYKLFKYPNTLSFEQILFLIVGLVVSFIVAKLVIEKFMNYLRTKPMRIFAIYRIIIGIIILVFFLLK